MDELQQTEEDGAKEPALSQPLFKTPTPTPSVFEWREQVQVRLKLAEAELSDMRRSSRQNAAADLDPARTHKNLRLLKEIEDDEQTFQRATTKAAIDAARAETDKAVQRAVEVEKQYHKLEGEVSRITESAEEKHSALQHSDQRLQEQIDALRQENQGLHQAIGEIRQQLKGQEKHSKDLEDALFFLSDELTKAKEATKKEGTPQRGGRMGAAVRGALAKGK